MPAIERNDPYQSSRFLVEIDGLIVGGFSEISGLQAETELDEIKEGGVNDHIHKLPKATRYSNITLKRGITVSDALWRWHQEVIDGRIVRRSIYIVLLGSEGEERWRWHFLDAFPVKWNGPDLKADGNAVALESLELAHHGLKKA